MLTHNPPSPQHLPLPHLLLSPHFLHFLNPFLHPPLFPPPPFSAPPPLHPTLLFLPLPLPPPLFLLFPLPPPLLFSSPFTHFLPFFHFTPLPHSFFSSSPPPPYPVPPSFLCSKPQKIKRRKVGRIEYGKIQVTQNNDLNKKKKIYRYTQKKKRK